MKFITLKNISNFRLIQNVIIHPLKINKDESGTLVETLRIDWPAVYGKERKFFMQYSSVVPSGVAKDLTSWHYHTYQEDRIVLLQGEIIFAIADNRNNSSTKNRINLFYMTSEINPFMLIVPKKTLHGFVVVSKEKAVIVNFPTALYNSKDNISIPFNEAKICLSNDMPFTWDKIKELFKREQNYI